MTEQLESVLTLKEAAQLARAMGLPLHYRHDLIPLCNAQLIPATKRANAWLVTRPTVRALVSKLLGLSIRARRALYTSPEHPLVDLHLPGGHLDDDLLLGYTEIATYCQQTLGWHPTVTLLAKNLPQIEHRHAGCLVVTTKCAVQRFFLTFWRHKLRRWQTTAPGQEQVPRTILSLAQMLLGERPGQEVGPEVVAALQATLEAAQAEPDGDAHA